MADKNIIVIDRGGVNLPHVCFGNKKYVCGSVIDISEIKDINLSELVLLRRIRICDKKKNVVTERVDVVEFVAPPLEVKSVPAFVYEDPVVSIEVKDEDKFNIPSGKSDEGLEGSEDSAKTHWSSHRKSKKPRRD